METVENTPRPPPSFPTVPTAPTTETMGAFLQNLTYTTATTLHGRSSMPSEARTLFLKTQEATASGWRRIEGAQLQTIQQFSQE